VELQEEEVFRHLSRATWTIHNNPTMYCGLELIFEETEEMPQKFLVRLTTGFY
jgi:hypothetical protein